MNPMLHKLLKQVLQRTVVAARTVAQQSGEWAAVTVWSFYDCPVTLHSSSSSCSSSRGGGSSSSSAGDSADSTSGKRKSASSGSSSSSSSRVRPSPGGDSIITTVVRGADQHCSELVAVIAAENLRPVT
jgi:hypothetical protein